MVDNIEVEAKARIDNPVIYRRRASKIGKYLGKKEKVDEYFTQESLNNYPKKSLRIRKIDGYFVANLKRRLSYEKGVDAKREIELKLYDYDIFVSMLKDLEFKRWLVKKKTTYSYEINKNFHIEINNVRYLGWFVEVEYLARKNEVGEARRRVKEVLEELGIKEKELIKEGYTKLLWKKRQK